MSAEEDPKVSAARAAHEEAKVSAAAAFAAYSRAVDARDAAGRELDDALGLTRCEMYEYGIWWPVVIVKREDDDVWVRTYGRPSVAMERFTFRDGEWYWNNDDDTWHDYRLRGVP